MDASYPGSSYVAVDPLRVNRALIWFVLLGGATAWTLHLLLAYGVAEFGCLSGMGKIEMGGLTWVAWMLLGVSALAAGLAGVAIVVSLRLHRRLRAGGAGGEGDRSTAFSVRLGLISNVVFAGVIVVQTIPIFYYLRGC
jgi:hypothetical protein